MAARTDLDELGFLRLGTGVVVWDRAQIICPEQISLGDYTMIDDLTLLNGKGGLQIGAYAHIVSFASITGGGGCQIGDFTSISAGARIFSGTENLDGYLFGPGVPPEFRRAIRHEVYIGDHVLIGTNAVVLPGARIFEGAIIGAGSVVLKDQVCDAWCIYAGSPARRIRERDSREVIRKAREMRHRQ